MRRSDHGSASLEFLSLGVTLLVPVIYLILVLFRLQAASFAAEAAARDAVRALATAPTEDIGRQRAAVAIDLALRDQGFDSPAARSVRLDCPTSGCLTPGAMIAAEVRIEVPVLWVPGRSDSPGPGLSVRASQWALVDPYRQSPRVGTGGPP
jgi:pimeloyl-ACP methyl ester carboxylesterase